MGDTAVMLVSEQLERDDLVRCVGRVEELGFNAIWLPELFGREPLATAGYLLAQTKKVNIGTGIANVYARDATAMAQARQTLAELSGGRFLLGLGVSNPMLNGSRGHEWEPPVSKMTSYLAEMAEIDVQGPKPKRPAPLYVAAHGPKLQALAASMADGILTWLMPVEHTRAARSAIGAERSLNAAAMFLLCDEPDRARQLARRAISMYVRLDYYHRAWSQLGFSDEDFENGGSDRLIDSIVAWGTEDQLAARVREYRDAGASEVIVVPIGSGAAEAGPDWRVLEAVVQT